MHSEDKIPTQPFQDMVYQWNCANGNFNSLYIGESSRCLESRVKKPNTLSASTIFQH